MSKELEVFATNGLKLEQELERHKMWLADLQQRYSEAMLEIDRLSHVPTADEVCEAIKKDGISKVYYDEDEKEFYTAIFGSDRIAKLITNKDGSTSIDIPSLLSPLVINFISRFYMVLTKKENVKDE